jgi:hypothetical protein
VDVVAVERDVDLAEVELEVGALLDQPPQPVREWHSAGVDPDERDGVELLVSLDDLVRDPRECAADGLTVEQNPPAGPHGMLVHRSPFRPHGTELKGMRVTGD